MGGIKPVFEIGVFDEFWDKALQAYESYAIDLRHWNLSYVIGKFVNLAHR